MPATQTQKTNHIQRLVKAVNALLAAAAQCRDVNAEAQSTSPGLGYLAGGLNALADSDFVVAGSPCMAADYNAILTALGALEQTCNAAGADGANGVWQELRLLSR